MIGDTIFDILAAKSVGIDAIGVSYGFGNTKDMMEGGAKLIVDRVEQLIFENK